MLIVRIPGFRKVTRRDTDTSFHGVCTREPPLGDERFRTIARRVAIRGIAVQVARPEPAIDDLDAVEDDMGVQVTCGASREAGRERLAVTALQRPVP